MVKVEIIPWDVNEALQGAADAGQGMETAALGADDGAGTTRGGFGTAHTAEAAFSTFWTERDRLGHQAAGVLFHQIEKVRDATASFIEMDGDMSTLAEQTVSSAQARSVTDVWGRS